MQYVYGSDRVANIKIYHNIHFKDKVVVESILRKEGLYDKYAKIDLIKVANDIKNETLPKHVIEKLKKFMEHKENIKIYLRSMEREE